MLKIGDFSKFSKVTVKTLRYYDQLGLLKPAQIDPFTGYRFYSASQLVVLNRILALKDLGLSLEQIAQMQSATFDLPQIMAMLKLKQAELIQHIGEERERLARIEARLIQIEKENNMPVQEVVIKPVEAQQVASVRYTLPHIKDISPTFDRLFDQVASYIYQHGAKIAGCGIALYHDSEFSETNMKIEAAFGISGDLTSSGEVQVYELPGYETMACIVHPGSFENIGQSYEAILKWIESNGYQMNGPNREVYLHYERNGDKSAWVTEIQCPVIRSGVS